MSRATDTDVRNLCHMTQSVVDRIESLEGRVEALAEVWHQYAWGPGEAGTTARVRAALGWGDEA